jgi:hypothetical protein
VGRTVSEGIITLIFGVDFETAGCQHNMDLYRREDLAGYLAWNNQVRGDTISRACSMHRTEESCIQSFGRKIEEGDQDVDG